MKAPLLSFCVPAFNEEKLLPLTLSNLENIRRELLIEGISSELLVCDNNSTDSTPKIAADFNAKVIFEPENKISKARNAVASLAEGEWLVFVDADTFPTLSLIQEMLHKINSGKCLGGGSLLKMDDTSWEARLFVGLWNLISRLLRWGAGSFLFVNRNAFYEIGCFNEDMYAAEELNLSWRAKIFAKKRGLTWRILTKNPILTSGRKMKLYSVKERLRLFYFHLRYREAAFRNKDFCSFWYDGRR